MRLTMLVFLLILSACAAMPEAKKEAREYRQTDFANRFLDYRRICHSRGGRVLINATGSPDRDGVPPRGSRYACSRSLTGR